MSKVAAFWEKARTDAGLKRQIREISARTAEETVTRVVDVAATAGYRFTAAEFRDELGRRTRDLSPEELGAVAGGLNNKNPELMRYEFRTPTATPQQIIAILIGL